MFTLKFDLDGVRRLAEHASSCSKHIPSVAQLIDGIQEGSPALEWVKDDGTYLLSNGVPQRKQNPDDPESPYESVYAEDWGSGTRQELAYVDEIGGDDFAIQLDLGQKVGNGLTLLDVIVRAHDKGRTWFLLYVRDDQLRFGFQ